MRFERGLSHLRVYVDQHGDGHVPRSWICPGCGFPLGRWVSQRRTAMREQNPSLTPERFTALRDAGFEPEPAPRGGRGPTNLHQQQWERGLGHLRDYVTEHGHADVPRRYTAADDFPLGMWVQSRRKELRAGTLTDPARLEALSALGFVEQSDRRGGFSVPRPQPDADCNTATSGEGK